MACPARCPPLLAIAALAACAVCGCGGGGGAGVAGGGTLEIRAVGGEGTAGDGGDGGAIFIQGATGSDILILKGGSVDPVLEPPPRRPALGVNPRIIAADVTLPTETVFGSVDPSLPATGLLVEPGATATLRPGTVLNFRNGVVIEGTVRAGVAGVDLQADDVLVTGSGRIDTKGLDGGSGPGLPGGNVAITALGSIASRGTIDASGGDGDGDSGDGDGDGGPGAAVQLRSTGAGSVHNGGTIDASGGVGHGGFGGGAGAVILFATQGAVVNTGDIRARGGVGRHLGGGGGPIALASGLAGAVASAGTLDGSGGSGVGEGPGGGAGELILFASGGTVRASGALIARGGDGAGANGGGGGGSVQIGNTDVQSGDFGQVVRILVLAQETFEVVVTHTLSDGRLVMEVFPSTRYRLRFEVKEQPSPGGTVLVGGISVGADIDTSGGRGASGGPAGAIRIGASATGSGGGDHDSHLSRATFVPGEEPIVLAGYRRIDVSGGRGTVDGGDAAAPLPENRGLFFLSPGVLVENVTATLDGVAFVGGIHNEVDWVGRGGEGVGDDGGRGAGLQLIAGAGERSTPCTVENFGSLDLRGGAGAEDGGRGGRVVLFDRLRVESHGEIDVSGGDSRPDQTQPGGSGGAVVLASDDVVVSTAPIRADGGRGEAADGGRGGLAVIAGRSVRSTGELSCRGGDGTAAGGTGGTFAGSQPVLSDDCTDDCDGGIVISSTERGSEVSGVLGVRGGDGVSAPGPDGRIVIDGIDVEPGAGGEARF